MNEGMAAAVMGGFGVFVIIIVTSVLAYKFYTKYSETEKTVKATVVKTEIKEPENKNENKKYIIYFQAGGEILSFNVSRYNYEHNYYKGQKGKLKYNGTNIIEFIQK